MNNYEIMYLIALFTAIGLIGFGLWAAYKGIRKLTAYVKDVWRYL